MGKRKTITEMFQEAWDKAEATTMEEFMAEVKARPCVKVKSMLKVEAGGRGRSGGAVAISTYESLKL